MPAPKRATTKTPKLLTFEQIQEAADLGEGIVEVPEWGGSVAVRGLSRGEIAKVDKQAGRRVKSLADMQGYEQQILAQAITTPEMTVEQAGVLAAKNLRPVNRILERVSRLSGITDTAPIEACEEVLSRLVALDTEDLPDDVLAELKEITQVLAKAVGTTAEARLENALLDRFPD